MRLRTKYILFIALLQIVTLILSFYVFKDNKILFIISEVFVLVSIGLAWQLYNELILPLNILQLDDSIKGKFLSELSHPILKQIGELQSGQSRTITFEGLNTYKLQMSHFIDRGFARNFVLIEELTAEILAAEKKVYGKVIRMMAHEVNNTIGPVNSIIDSALKTAQWGNQEKNNLKGALQIAIERNNNLNGFMRNFADLVKLPAPVKKQVDVN